MTISAEQLETAARKFCLIMNIPPDAVRKVAHHKMKNWQIAAQQVNEFIAMTAAVQEITQRPLIDIHESN